MYRLGTEHMAHASTAMQKAFLSMMNNEWALKHAKPFVFAWFHCMNMVTQWNEELPSQVIASGHMLRTSKKNAWQVQQ